MFKIGSKEINIEIPKGDFLGLFQMVREVDYLHDSINEQPVYPEWRETIQRMEFMRAVQGTVALEGSEMELKDVERVADRVGTEPLTKDTDKEAANALEAYEFIQDWSSSNPGGEISEAVIRQIHTIMTRDIDYYLNQPGKYRNQPVRFGHPQVESVLKDTFEVEEVMSGLVELINAKLPGKLESLDYAPITRAMLAHYLITLIHPFIDGNGRVARAIEALILHHCGKYGPYLFPITAKFYYRERKTYFEMLRNADNTGNPVPFIKFAVQGLMENLKEIKKGILDKITFTLIMDYAHQLRRRKKLLKRQVTLLETMFRFNLGPMELSEFLRHPVVRGSYHNLSESTRKRDILRLTSSGLLISKKERTKDGKEKTFISTNWDALKDVTLRLDVVPHRP